MTSSPGNGAAMAAAGVADSCPTAAPGSASNRGSAVQQNPMARTLGNTPSDARDAPSLLHLGRQAAIRLGAITARKSLLGSRWRLKGRQPNPARFEEFPSP